MKTNQPKSNFLNWLLSVSVAAMFLISLVFPGGSAQAAPSGVPYIIVFKDTVNPAAEAPGVANAHGLQLGFIYQHALKGMSALVPEGRLGALKHSWMAARRRIPESCFSGNSGTPLTASRVWEVPAGRLDHGETPERCAHRELEEEPGMRAESLEPLTTIYTTPGFTDERILLFLARGLEPGTHSRETDEFVDLHPTPWSEVRGMIRNREIVDGKTLVALLYAAAFAGLGVR